MHLDTLFTQVDTYTFVYHPITEDIKIFEITKDKNECILLNNSLEEVLEKVFHHSIKLICCAGGDEIASKREQWSDGANTLCISPGVVIVYDRNHITNELLRSEGIHTIEIDSAELSRGRGGPRCMSMPLIREDIKLNDKMKE